MTDKFRILTAEEAEVCHRNGIEAEGVSVILSNEDTLVLRKHKTGDEIFIHAGFRHWYTDNSDNPKRLGNKKGK